MAATAINPQEHVLQQLGTHAVAQANVQARMAGELTFRPQLSQTIANKPDWLRVLQGVKETPVQTPQQPPQQTPQAPPLPTQLGPFNSGYISFSGGIPVGGWMSLAIFQDGSYSFSGHFHDSGAPSYDVDAVWVIVSNSGKAFSFEVKGHLNGTFQSGSRDYDFAQNGQNGAIKDAWADLCAGYHWRWSAYVNWDVQAAVDDVVNALKAAGAVIGAVVAVVALL